MPLCHLQRYFQWGSSKYLSTYSPHTVPILEIEEFHTAVQICTGISEECLYLRKGEYFLDKSNNLLTYIHFYAFPTKYVPTSYDNSGFVASLTVPKLSTAAQPQCTASMLKITNLAETTRNNNKNINQITTIASFPNIHACRYRDNLTPYRTKTWVWVWSQDASA